MFVLGTKNKLKYHGALKIERFLQHFMIESRSVVSTASQLILVLFDTDAHPWSIAISYRAFVGPELHLANALRSVSLLALLNLSAMINYRSKDLWNTNERILRYLKERLG